MGAPSGGVTVQLEPDLSELRVQPEWRAAGAWWLHAALIPGVYSPLCPSSCRVRTSCPPSKTVTQMQGLMLHGHSGKARPAVGIACGGHAGATRGSGEGQGAASRTTTLALLVPRERLDFNPVLGRHRPRLRSGLGGEDRLLPGAFLASNVVFPQDCQGTPLFFSHL